MQKHSDSIGGLERLRSAMSQQELERLQASIARESDAALLLRYVSARESARFLNALANIFGRILIFRPNCSDALEGLRQLASPEMPLGVRVAAVEALGASETSNPHARDLLIRLAREEREDVGLREALGDALEGLEGA